MSNWKELMLRHMAEGTSSDPKKNTPATPPTGKAFATGPIYEDIIAEKEKQLKISLLDEAKGNITDRAIAGYGRAVEKWKDHVEGKRQQLSGGPVWVPSAGVSTSQPKEFELPDAWDLRGHEQGYGAGTGPKEALANAKIQMAIRGNPALAQQSMVGKQAAALQRQKPLAEAQSQAQAHANALKMIGEQDGIAESLLASDQSRWLGTPSASSASLAKKPSPIPATPAAPSADVDIPPKTLASGGPVRVGEPVIVGEEG
ncbi:hypothetical protein MBAV_002892, partial [Candidatus Magnetobacterium bavaricum]